MENIIEVKDLWEVYSEKEVFFDVDDRDLIAALDESNESVVAVRGVSFTVKPGEVFIVMGLSGSGKSEKKQKKGKR